METGARVAQAIYFAITCGLLILLGHWLTSSPRKHMPTRAAMLRDAVMSRYFVAAPATDNSQNDDESPEESNDESGESGIAMQKETRSDQFRFPDNFAALAALVKAGKLGEMDALRYGIGVTPGSSARYKAARAALTAALAALEPSHFAPLTQEQIDSRRQLGLDQK